MKISVASLAIALLAEVVVARNCKGGLDYCGHTLLAIGTVINQNFRVQTHYLTFPRRLRRRDANRLQGKVVGLREWHDERHSFRVL